MRWSNKFVVHDVKREWGDTGKNRTLRNTPHDDDDDDEDEENFIPVSCLPRQMRLHWNEDVYGR